MELGNMLFGNSRERYPVDRQKTQKLFERFFAKYGLDGYGYPEKGSLFDGAMQNKNGDAVIDNECFSIRPYYWGEDEYIAALPNFVFKPGKVEIRWYKYPMRDAYSNIPLDERTVREMLTACERWIAKNMKE